MESETAIAVGGRRRAFALYLGMQFSLLGVTTLQALLVMPQMLKSLGQERYGVWLAFSELLMWLQYSDLGLSNWLLQRVSLAARDGDGEAIGEQLQAVLLIVLVVAGAVALVLAVGVAFVLRRFGATDAVVSEFMAPALVSVAASLALALTNPFVALSRGLQKPELMGVAHITAGFIALGMTWLLAVRGYGVWAMAAGSMVRGVVVLAAACLFYRRVSPAFGFTGLRMRKARFDQALHVAPAVAGGNVGYLLGNQAQISFVALMVAPALAARFAFTKKLFDVVRTVFDAMAAAVLGFASDAYAEGTAQARQRVRMMLYGCAIGFAVISTSLAAISEWVIGKWVGPSMFIGSGAVAALAAGTATAGIAYVANNVLRGAGGHRAAGNLLFAEGGARASLTFLAARAGSIASVSGAGFVSGSLMLAGVSRFLRGTASADELNAFDAVGMVLICGGLPALWLVATSMMR
jgi:O-antigen/teichoic acid export membrane protein